MFNLFGLNVHLYGLLIGIGIWIGFEVDLRRKKDTVTKQILENVLLWAVCGGIIGARFYHVIDYWQRYYSTNLIKVLFVWEGGLGIWGAITGAMLTIFLYSRVKKINFLSLVDDLIVGVPIAQAIGRIGNFVNGELYGKNGEPLFAYEAGLNLLLFFLLWKIAKKHNKTGFLTGMYLIGYGIIRILLEGMRPEAIIWKIYGVPTAVVFGILSTVIGVYFTKKDSLFPKYRNKAGRE